MGQSASAYYVPYALILIARVGVGKYTLRSLAFIAIWGVNSRTRDLGYNSRAFSRVFHFEMGHCLVSRGTCVGSAYVLSLNDYLPVCMTILLRDGRFANFFPFFNNRLECYESSFFKKHAVDGVSPSPAYSKQACVPPNVLPLQIYLQGMGYVLRRSMWYEPCLVKIQQYWQEACVCFCIQPLLFCLYRAVVVLYVHTRSIGRHDS